MESTEMGESKSVISTRHSMTGLYLIYTTSEQIKALIGILIALRK
jgi:hypothetical protein